MKKNSIILFYLKITGKDISFFTALIPAFILLPFFLAAQQPAGSHPPVVQDSIYKTLSNNAFVKKRFGRAAGDIVLAETTPWLVDNYLRKVEYTRISWQTLSYNLSPAHWAWDGDGFTTNQFGHPFHGSLFFNSFRCNGYSFWQSSLASFAGSYLWETAAENQAPAPNDFINTGFGGIILGEMTHQLSDKLINNRKLGFRRQAGEAAAFIINPMNGFNRIIDGRWGRLNPNSKERDSAVIYTEFDLGLRQFRNNNSQGKYGLYGHVKFMYGTPSENYKTAFSNMLINAEFGKDDSSGVNIVSVYGSLYGWKIPAAKNNRQTVLLTANYDYIRNSAFFYSAQGVRLNLYSVFGLSGKLKISTTAGASLIILAAVPDPHGYKSRYYNYCMGVGFSGSCIIAVAGHFYLGVSYRGGWLRTMNGNSSHYFLHTTTGEMRYMVSNGFSICAEPGYFTLHGNYADYEDVHKTYPYARVSVRYSFNIR